MSKYIKLDDAIDAVMNTEAVFADVTAEPYQKTRDVTQALHSLPTIEVSEKVEDERCKGCKHYKLACDLFSEICKYEPITQTETQNSNLTFEIADTPKAKVSEDAISRANLIKSFLADCECESREEAGAVTLKLEDMLELIEEEPSVIPQVPRKHTR